MKEFERLKKEGLPDSHIYDENTHHSAFILTLDNRQLEELREYTRHYYDGKDGDDMVHFIIHIAIDQFLIDERQDRLKRRWGSYPPSFF